VKVLRRLGSRVRAGGVSRSWLAHHDDQVERIAGILQYCNRLGLQLFIAFTKLDVLQSSANSCVRASLRSRPAHGHLRHGRVHSTWAGPDELPNLGFLPVA
jgi:hypothetical protein